MPDLPQSWPRPSAPRPIVFIGGGGIVRTAHIPAYRRLGFPIAGVVRRRPRGGAPDGAHLRAAGRVRVAAAAAAASEAVFDVAVPGDQIAGILEQLPEGAAVLIQKPMGRDFAEARRILRCCQAAA